MSSKTATTAVPMSVVDRELGQGDAVLDESVAIGLHRGVVSGFEQELRPVRGVGRHHGEPGVVAERDVVTGGEAEHLGVEGEGGSLIVDEDAGQVDPHGVFLRLSGQRRAMVARGSPSK